MPQLELNILGCGSAKPSRRHAPSSQVLNTGNNLYMIDCGEGTQTRLMLQGLKPGRLNNIFISHLHGDHWFGLPGLISTLGLNGREGVLNIHILREGAEMLQSIFKFMGGKLGIELNYNIISPSNEVIWEDSRIKVSSFPLRHRVPCVGFRFDEQPKMRHINREMCDFHGVPVFRMDALRRGEDFIKPDGTIIPNKILTTDADPSVSYAYCSDTMPSEKVVKAIEEVDWLYHEATYTSDFASQAHDRGHSTARQAAEIALKANVGNLIIGHYSSRYTSDEPLLNEAKAIFPNTIAANEGETINLTSILSL